MFGTTPSGPIPNEDTVITSSTNPTAAIVGQLSQPLSQLHRIKLQIKQQEMSSEISRAQLSATEQALVNEVKRAYYAILQSQGAAQAAETNIKLYRELDRVTGEYVVQQVVLKTEHMDVQTRLAKAEYEVMTIQNQLIWRRKSSSTTYSDATYVPNSPSAVVRKQLWRSCAKQISSPRANEQSRTVRRFVKRSCESSRQNSTSESRSRNSFRT